MTDQNCNGTATLAQTGDVPLADPPQSTTGSFLQAARTTGSHAAHVRDKKLVDALDANQEWKQPKNYQRPVITLSAIGVLVVMCAFACAQEERSTAKLQSSLSDGVKEVRQKSADIATMRQNDREKQSAHRATAQRHDRSMKRKHTM